VRLKQNKINVPYKKRGVSHFTKTLDIKGKKVVQVFLIKLKAQDEEMGLTLSLPVTRVVVHVAF